MQHLTLLYFLESPASIATCNVLSLCSKRIVTLFRYRCLGNLSHVLNKSEYLTANAGLSFDYQLINVPDFNGVGESQPSPFFYQVSLEYCLLSKSFANVEVEASRVSFSLLPIHY